MLILSRKCGESLIINDDIEVKVTEISGDRVKIGIKAPKDFKIFRKELCLTVEDNKKAASGGATKELLHFLAGLDEAQAKPNADQESTGDPNAAGSSSAGKI